MGNQGACRKSCNYMKAVLRMTLAYWIADVRLGISDWMSARVPPAQIFNLQAPQARNVNNRRWSEQRERNRRKRINMTPALQEPNMSAVQLLQSWGWCCAFPPVPRYACLSADMALHRRLFTYRACGAFNSKSAVCGHHAVRLALHPAQTFIQHFLKTNSWENYVK